MPEAEGQMRDALVKDLREAKERAKAASIARERAYFAFFPFAAQ
jgi:hypothetical protein